MVIFVEKELMKPMRFKHFNVGHKLNNQMHAQLRLGRSKLNSHLHQIGISITPACKCGQLETVKHFLLDCKLHDVARLQLYEKLGGLLAGLHKLWYPGIRDRSTWSKFGAHGEHGDVFLFSNLGAL